MLTLVCSGCNIHYSDEVVCTWIQLRFHTYTTVDNEAYAVYVYALSYTVESHTVVQSVTRSHCLVGVM